MPLFSRSAWAPHRSRHSTITDLARQVIHPLATATSRSASSGPAPEPSSRRSQRSRARRCSRLIANTVAMATARGPWWLRWAITGTGREPRGPEMYRWPP